jgi:tRNA(fMet)-specific endonuclease VapC
MTFLLDTDTCIYWLRAHPVVRQHLASAGPESVAVSVVTVAELRYGAACSSQPEENHQAIDDFLSGVAVVSLDETAAWEFGLVKATLRRAGHLIEDLDILIAVTALVHDLTLVSNNTEHFRRVDGLHIATWAS